MKRCTAMIFLTLKIIGTKLRTTTGKHIICITVFATILLSPFVWERIQRSVSRDDHILQEKELNSKRVQTADKLMANLNKARIKMVLKHTAGNQRIFDGISQSAEENQRIFDANVKILQPAAGEQQKGESGAGILESAEGKQRIHGNAQYSNQWKVDIAVTVITNIRKMKRDDYSPRYLTQVVTKFLSLAEGNKSFPLTMRFLICNVEPEPETHNEAAHFSDLVTVFSRRKGLPGIPIDTFEKEKMDYIFCLNSSLLFHPRYVLLVEDDAVPKRDMWDILKYTITHLEAKYTLIDTPYDGPSSSDNFNIPADKIAYVKLYHPEHLLGYISAESERLMELLGISALFGTILTVLYLKILLILKPSVNINIHLLWLIFCVLMILTLLVIGRTPLLELRHFFAPHLYTLVPAPSCCTQAVLFPVSSVHQLIDYMNKVQCYKHYAKDSVLEDYVDVSKMEAYQVLPNAFSHVGLYSSLRDRYVNPRGLS